MSAFLTEKFSFENSSRFVHSWRCCQIFSTVFGLNVCRSMVNQQNLVHQFIAKMSVYPCRISLPSLAVITSEDTFSCIGLIFTLVHEIVLWITYNCVILHNGLLRPIRSASKARENSPLSFIRIPPLAVSTSCSCESPL